MKKRMMMISIMAAALMLGACGQAVGTVRTMNEETAVTQESGNAEAGTKKNTAVATVEVKDTDGMFSERDLLQTPDLTDAVYLTVSDGEDITIDEEGIYVLSGKASDSTVYVDADDNEKVQLVTDGLVMSNTDTPCIYVKNADKVFITALSEDNSLSVSGSFKADGDTNTDAVIYSKDDLVFNGTGMLAISSTDNGISGKDDIKITGGSLLISCEGSAIEAKDEILIADGNIEITNCNDGLHAEDDDDDSAGYIYIGGGTIDINAADDGIHATATVILDEGDITISAAEGIEATVVQVNGGTTDIKASDDGINAANKCSSMSPLFEMNDGTVSIAMGAGDTDGVDSNGDIRINGGTISITGQSTFDYNGTAEYNGGTIIENGEETNTITNQTFGPGGNMGDPGMMGGHGMRGPGMMDESENMFNPEDVNEMRGHGPMDGNFQMEGPGRHGPMEDAGEQKE